jgi:hypothetical protein
MSLAKTLHDHAASDHIRGCMGRQYHCSCGYDTKTEELLPEAAARIEALEAALHEAFMAMCAYRDNKDEEVFQDAIDALGLAALAPEQDR